MMRMRAGWGHGEGGVEQFVSQQDSLSTPAAMTVRVLNDARRTLGEEIDETFLERCAREAVDALWSDEIRVKTFVPVLALRQIREAVDARSDELSA